MEKFQQLVLKELPGLMRYATALTGNYKNAEDLLAVGLENCLNQLDHRDPNLNLKYWLLAILHNVYMEPKNGFQIESQRKQDSEQELKAASKFDKLSLQKLQTALQSLPPLQKQVLILVTLEEIPYKDVKTITGLSLNNIMALLHQSRKIMRLHTFPKVATPKVAI